MASNAGATTRNEVLAAQVPNDWRTETIEGSPLSVSFPTSWSVHSALTSVTYPGGQQPLFAVVGPKGDRFDLARESGEHAWWYKDFAEYKHLTSFALHDGRHTFKQVPTTVGPFPACYTIDGGTDPDVHKKSVVGSIDIRESNDSVLSLEVTLFGKDATQRMAQATPSSITSRCRNAPGQRTERRTERSPDRRGE